MKLHPLLVAASLLPLASPAVSTQAPTGVVQPGVVPVEDWSIVEVELEPEEQARLAALRATMSESERLAFLSWALFLPVGARGQLVGRLVAGPPANQHAFAALLGQLSAEQQQDLAGRSIDLDRGTFDWVVRLSAEKPASRIRYILFEHRRSFGDPEPPPDQRLDPTEDMDLSRYWIRIGGVTNAEIAPEFSAPWQAEIYKSGASASPMTPLEVRRERDHYGDTLMDFERWHDCGGVVISARLVLTAAHCIKEPKMGPYLDNRRVRTGTRSLISGGTTWRIAGVVRNGQYNNMSKAHDIALLLIAADGETKPANNRDARVARLPTLRDPALKSEERLTLTGWGATGETDVGSVFLDRAGKPKRASPWLMFGELKNVGWDRCNENALFKRDRNVIGKGQICALGDGRVDACQGDSGGPLVRYLRGSPVVVGLVSYGKGCGLPDTPGVYVDLSEYRGWIAEAKRAMRPGQIVDWPPRSATE